MKDMTRRDLQESIKRKYTFADFEAEFGLDRDALEKRISRLYKKTPAKVGDLLREITKNGKKPMPKTIANYKGVPIEDIKKMSVDEFIQLEYQTDEGAPKNKLDEPKTESASHTPTTDDVQDIPEDVLLEDKIFNAEKQQYNLEVSIKKWFSKRREGLKDISAIASKLMSIQNEMETLRNKLSSAIEVDAKIVAKINSLKQQYEEGEVELEEDYRKLDELKTVVLCIYKDDGIKLESSSVEVVLDDTGHEELFMELVMKPECAELKAREIDLLARLIKIVGNSTRKFDIICDNNELEKAFHSLYQPVEA